MKCYSSRMESGTLIVLRGPSGAGKSTVARMLHEQAVRKTALIEQDHYRHVMFNNPHSELEAARQVMFASIRSALEHGYDVITEGILSMGRYRPYFDRLFDTHPHRNHLFYMDIDFDESVRRHATRDKQHLFSISDMREWYDRATPSGYPGEVLLAADLTAEESVRNIAEIGGIALR